MASISISIDHNATIIASMHPGIDVMAVDVSCDLPPHSEGGDPIPYDRTQLLLHGSPAEVAAFAHAILAAIPPDVCIAGDPAVSGVCGDPECVCAPQVVPA